LEQKIISIIIPTYNSGKTIKRCIDSLNSQQFSRDKFEIIVVDDGSSDETINIAKQSDSDVVVESQHLGSSVTRTIGVSHSKGNFLAFLDSDCEAQKDWLSTIVKELEKHHLITGPIKNGIEGNLVSWSEYFLNFAEFNEYVPRSIVRMAPGCNFAVKKDAYNKVGGFKKVQSSFDIIFGETMRRAGFECFFVPEMKIQHLGLADTDKLIKKMTIRGSSFIKTRKEFDTLPFSFLTKRKFLIPLLFCGKIFTSLKYAIQAKKVRHYMASFHITIRAVASYTNGALQEVNDD